MDPEAPAVGAQPLRGPRARGAQPLARAARRGRGPRGPRASPARRSAMSAASSGSRAPSTTTSAGADARAARRVDPGLRAAPEGDAHRHVGALAGGRRRAVVDVDVAVDVGDAERSDRRRAGPPARRAPARSSRRAPAVARRRRRRRARPRARPPVVASVSAMPITPVAGSRSSPRIRTSRSPRSSAPMRAGRPCSRTAAGACSVPPARPTESIGTPIADQGADTRGGYRRGRSPGVERRSYPVWTGEDRRSTVLAGARRRLGEGLHGAPGRRAGCEPAGRLVHTTVGAGDHDRRAGARLLGRGDGLGARRRARRAGPARRTPGWRRSCRCPRRRGGSRPRSARSETTPSRPAGETSCGAPKRAEGSVDATRTREFAPSKPVHATRRVAALSCAMAIGAWLRFEPSRSRSWAARKRWPDGRTATSLKTGPRVPPSVSSCALQAR